MQINDSNPYALFFANGSYVLSSITDREDRRIFEYIRNNQVKNAIDFAVDVIIKLIEHFKFCPIFKTKPKEEFRNTIANNKYLIINKDVICLSDEDPPSEEFPSQHLDLYFSCRLIDTPVKCDCSEKHYFELKNFTFWKSLKVDVCPVSKEKAKFISNSSMKNDHACYLSQRKRDLETRKELIKVSGQVQSLQTLQKIIPPPDPLTLGGGLGKVLFKTGGEIAKSSFKSQGKRIVKTIPWVSFLAGLVSTCYRFSKGDYRQGCAEFASGVAGCFLGVGTMISISIDTSLLMHDIHEAYQSINEHNKLVKSLGKPKETITLSIPLYKALEALGLPTDRRPSKEEIDKAFRDRSLNLHPDPAQKNEVKNIVQEANDIQVMNEAVRKEIYKFYGYDLPIELQNNASLIQKKVEDEAEDVVVEIENEAEFDKILEVKKQTKCDIILNFLKNPEDRKDLDELNLSPSKVNVELEYHHFESVIDELSMIKDAKLKKILRENFQHFYPEIYKRNLEERERKRNNPNVKEQLSNPYSVFVQELEKFVVGQTFAVATLASQLNTQLDSTQNNVYLFAGPPGTGKTELAKAVSKVQNDNKKFIYLKMERYQTPLGLNDIFGSDTGCVGSTDKSHFAKELDKCKPTIIKEIGPNQVTYEINNAVILFDEIEKAHKDVKNAFLNFFTLFDYTCKHVKQGQNAFDNYVFKGCIFINTTNHLANHILDSIKHKDPIDKISNDYKEFNNSKPSQYSFSEAFLSRMGTIIPFGPIPKGKCYQSVIEKNFQIHLDELKKEFNEVIVASKDSILSVLENELYGEGIDLRKIPDYFANNKTIINMEKSKWKHSPEVISLVLLIDDGKFSFRASIFDTFEDKYYDIVSQPIHFQLKGFY